MSHLGDLWDLGGVDGPAVLGHGHSVPGLFSLHALFSLFSLISLISWIYEAKETHRRVKQTGHQTIFMQEWHFWLFLLYMMNYNRSANRWEGVGGFLSAVWHNSVSAGYRDRKCACMHAGFLSHCSCVDVSLSLKEDLDCGPDLAVSCCPWRAAAGALFSAPPALQSSPPCGSARWSSGPGRLSWTPSCAEGIIRNTSDLIGCQAQRKTLVNLPMIITKRQMCWQIYQPFSCLFLCSSVMLNLEVLFLNKEDPCSASVALLILISNLILSSAAQRDGSSILQETMTLNQTACVR